jgi:signal transduction histidine kinase
LNRLQEDRERILVHVVTSLQAAQELELRIRQLRYHGFIYVLDPTKTHRQQVEQDHLEFEDALRRSRDTSDQMEQLVLVNQIESGYRQYRSEIEDQSRWPKAPLTIPTAISWADAHPVRHLMGPCDELIRLHQISIETTRRENEALTIRTRTKLILMAIGGVVGGLLVGAFTAWGLSRSITRLRLQIQMAHQALDVVAVQLTADDPPEALDRLMATVLDRVRAVVAQVQEQERDLLRSEQLAVVGQLAAGVAHEIRNPLTGVKMLVESALRTDAVGLNRVELGMTLEEIRRIERTVQGLLDFAKISVAKRSRHDLGMLILHAVESVKPQADSRGVHVIPTAIEPPVSSMVDGDQVISLLTNLLINGIEATPLGGKVMIKTERTSENRVQLTVSDEGAGIDPSVKDRLFSPFTTTKPSGSGLGLSVARRIAQSHGGNLTAANRPEGGACFTWILPLNEVPNA